jgi:preprotein translocase subunit SecG
MHRSTLFYAAITLAAVTLILAIYYLIPSIYHPHLSLHHFVTFVKKTHRIYAGGFFVLAIVFGLLAFRLRPRKALTQKA